MGTTQHLALFEHATGYALFRIKEFDEITRSFTAHVNAFIKPIAFLHFKSVEEAVENVNCISQGVVSYLLKEFIRTNVPTKSAILGVNDEALGKAILACQFGFECVWHGGFREVLRVIRQNFARLTKSLITQPGNAFSLSLGQHHRPLAKTGSEEQISGRVAESRARLVVGLARARSQLNLSQHLADTAVVRALTLIDELDDDLTQSVRRLRACYASHFPEVCRNTSAAGCLFLTDLQLINLIAHCPVRSELCCNAHEEEMSQVEILFPVLDKIRQAARDSIGTELSMEDANQLKSFAVKLLRTMETRNRYAVLLARRVETLAPNLSALLKSTLSDNPFVNNMRTVRLGDTLSPALVAARLITNAGSLTRLANMPTSRVLSLGASKALFRKSGAVAANSTGLFGQVVRGTTSSTINPTTSANDDLPATLTTAQLKTFSANRIQPDTVRRKAARLLAAKSALACKADCFRYHNPPDADTPGLQWTEDPRLKEGIFGEKLAHDVHHQLRVWAETNGVHADRTDDQIKAQRDRRKKYRKAKRKAWLLRKLSRSATTTMTTANESQELGNQSQNLYHSIHSTKLSTIPQSGSPIYGGLSHMERSTSKSTSTDDDSDIEDDRPLKRRKPNSPRIPKTTSVLNACSASSSTTPVKRPLTVSTKSSISVTG